MNRLISTRGVDGEDSSLKNAILSSQPLDGGLYVFDHLPQFSADELRAMQDMTYSQLAKTLLGKADSGSKTTSASFFSGINSRYQSTTP